MEHFTLNTIDPFLRYVHYIELSPTFTSHTQIAYDHRLFFCLQGAYRITAAGEVYALKENSLLFVPSGIPYRLHEPEGNVHLLGINFDFSGHYRTQTLPIMPAIGEGSFDRFRLLECYTFEDIKELNAPFLLEDQQGLLSLLYQMNDEYTTKKLYYGLRNDCMLKSILLLVARSLVAGPSPAPQNTAEVVIRFIQEHYQEPLSNLDIGQALSFHPNYLNRLMLRHTGKTLHQYLLAFRLTKALDFLQTTGMTVTEIAHQTGFSSLQQFSKFFQAQTGFPPTHFR